MLWVKMLLPAVNKRVYNLQSKQLIKLYSQVAVIICVLQVTNSYVYSASCFEEGCWKKKAIQVPVHVIASKGIMG